MGRETYVAQHRKVAEEVENGHPNADVSRLLWHRFASGNDELVRVKTNLENVVEQRKQRSQRERSYEERNEAELDN